MFDVEFVTIGHGVFVHVFNELFWTDLDVFSRIRGCIRVDCRSKILNINACSTHRDIGVAAKNTAYVTAEMS